ncbi:hypothetical protein WQ54_11770 [Bacillus sp. SA1-12]|uniref:DUF3891 family protein n=1 Tax=Bacillus sp. SA1-12 TaxID=1455638 RepID=UPI0006255795|nr:DUF3891 family protein [Bacillus sp. SA1-12]KKI91965.1 hypothetical protein WQ54_11770 [Bacillus sp. SA1-12]
MIVYEDKTSFFMTEQHEHALLAECFAQNWKDEYFFGDENKEAVLFAIAQHDRSWLDVDVSPVWNDKVNKPYTFIDFPHSIKLSFYEKGIDEIEEKNAYSALLSSIHYTRFFDGMNLDKRMTSFLNKEVDRQKRLLAALHLKENDKNVSFHYHLLKFCDHLSLFVCMQEAGTVEEKVHSWFKKGIVQPFSFFKEDMFNVKWKNEVEISLQPFPFRREFEVSIPMREVSKVLLKKNGILEAFHQTPAHERRVTITSK